MSEDARRYSQKVDSCSAGAEALASSQVGTDACRCSGSPVDSAGIAGMLPAGSGSVLMVDGMAVVATVDVLVHCKVVERLRSDMGGSNCSGVGSDEVVAEAHSDSGLAGVVVAAAARCEPYSHLG